MQLFLFCRLEEEKNAAAAVLKDESEQLRSEVDKRSRESENIATVLAEKTVIIKVIHRKKESVLITSIFVNINITVRVLTLFSELFSTLWIAIKMLACNQ